MPSREVSHHTGNWRTPQIERCHILGLDGLPVSPCSGIVIWQVRTSGPATEKCQGTLGCEKTISVADLPDLRATAFIRSWLEPTQPIQKAVVTQRLQGANNGVLDRFNLPMIQSREGSSRPVLKLIRLPNSARISKAMLPKGPLRLPGLRPCSSYRCAALMIFCTSCRVVLRQNVASQAPAR